MTRKCWMKVGGLIVVVVLFSYLFYKHSAWFQWSHQPWQYMPNMHRTESLKPQRGFGFFQDFSGSRTPPQGSLARNEEVYKFKGPEFTADKVDRHSNPYAISRNVVTRGKFVYENNCAVCHGRDGNGNGSVVPPFTNPPSLNSDKIRGYADSQIYHVITNGQNVMGSYAPTIRPQDRWAAVHYVRVLQLADRPSDADLESFETMKKGAKQ